MPLRKIVLLFLGCLLSTFALGQAKRAMTIIDLLEVPRLGDPRMSPDGSQLVYTLAEADWRRPTSA